MAGTDTASEGDEQTMAAMLEAGAPASASTPMAMPNARCAGGGSEVLRVYFMSVADFAQVRQAPRSPKGLKPAQCRQAKPGATPKKQRRKLCKWRGAGTNKNLHAKLFTAANNHLRLIVVCRVKTRRIAGVRLEWHDGTLLHFQAAMQLHSATCCNLDR